mmetsp:Transcript_130660/g.377982  ORF Transcript_130660/g.377982 Transcript_130660/m.377982 type:complete len:444 (-) Transcript_130660:89-1420(-)
MWWLAAIVVVGIAAVAAGVRLPRRSTAAQPLRVAFVHPDLGIGGAERLVVDAALELQKHGHSVTIFTARHEPSHCFAETRDGSLKVVVFGDFLPRRVLGRFYAACAYLRMCWVALRLALMQFSSPFDVIIVDQVSICLPMLRLARPGGIIFYCHYPDKLLTGRDGLAKRLYRAPLDLAEELTTGLADTVFVNSKFTAGVFAEAFPILNRTGIKPSVLYPALDLAGQDKSMTKAGEAADLPGEGEYILLSINRFERKKNVGLAIRAVAALPEELKRRTHLVVAGGYDERLPENVEHAAELEALAKELHVEKQVKQMRSVDDPTKAALLKRADCVLYTPDREHLGIVPLEAMYARVPVLAVASGGPLETISDGETGFLRPPDPAAWAEVIGRVLPDSELRGRLGEAGRQRVARLFSLEAFGNTLDEAVHRLAPSSGGQPGGSKND